MTINGKMFISTAERQEMPKLRGVVGVRILILAALLASSPIFAQQGQPVAPGNGAAAGQGEDTASTGALQKATQNPVANLISVPIQNNSNFEVGPYNRTQDILNIQPVIPVKLSDQWNLITRTIQPIVWQTLS